MIPAGNMLNSDIVNAETVYSFKIAVKNLVVSDFVKGRALVAGQSAQPLPTVGSVCLCVCMFGYQ